MKKTASKISRKRLSYDVKIDAYIQAIDFLRSQECAYDAEDDYQEARLRLANRLDKECSRWVRSLRPIPKESKCRE